MKLKKEYTLREIGETRILVNEGEIVNLTKVLPMNETAAWLWKEASGQEQFTQEWLEERLMGEYGIDAATAADGASEMVSLWRKYNLLAEE